MTVSKIPRYYPCIPKQPHPWGIGRAHRYLTTSGSGIQSNNRTLSSLCPTRIPRTAIRLPEGRLLASYRARCSSRHESKHAAANAHTVGRASERGGESIRGKDQEVEGTGALQGKRHLREWGNYQAKGEEDQVEIVQCADRTRPLCRAVIWILWSSRTAAPGKHITG